MKVAYIRVSSTSQNPARQREAIGEVERVFEDKLSGKNRQRPALREMIDFVREGDEVVIASIDRLARSLADLFGIVEELTGKGVRVRFLKENLLISNEEQDFTGRLVLSIFGAIAEFQRKVIREQQAEGIAVAKRTGKYAKPGALSVEQVAQAEALVSQGIPKAEVARRLGVGRETLRTALNRAGAYASMPKAEGVAA
ncbi:recombinase family protein [Nesterenkonia sandarakina]|uniref:DNA invertase Pin-like site-specific DNA recombinase n=1 Tax=Nesterenkonia sandarakina TaxID=272918 RepID=A0A2T0YSB8_9MICC|nr:recombinase family protein [Nesterenkonia sandarakina]PRZ18698.1 DNA invertase Pin-like site-specific DNA recombinase [Nesterenkonia sandarakina]